MSDKLQLTIHRETDDEGNKTYLGLDASCPDDTSMAELIGYLQLAAADLATNTTKIRQYSG